MKPLRMALAIALGIGLAAVGAGAAGNESPDDKAETAQPATDAETVAETKKPLKPPPGFKLKRRGKFLLYCKREAPMGSRLKAETCYDEDQMRAYLLELEAGKVDIDRTRAICSNPCVCGQPC